MFTLSELEKWRTKSEMWDFYNDIYSRTASNSASTAIARLKHNKTLYKELFEEYYPLMIFCELYFKNIDIKCRYVGKSTAKENSNQKYDGEVLCNDEIIKIEIVAPRDGQKEKTFAVQLNESGASDFEMYELESAFQCIKAQVVESAIKKSKKSYDGIVLVICFSDLHLFRIDPTVASGLTLIQKLVIELKAIQYSSPKVFFLIPPFDKNNAIFGGMIFKIK